MTSRLTTNDIDTLLRADTLERQFHAGIFPRGAGQHRHFKRLERLGLLCRDGWGRDMDREVEGEVMLYRLTVAGRAMLATKGSQ